MSRIDLGDNILNPKTVPATVEGFYQRTDDRETRRICSELADLWEQKLRGTLTDEEYKKLKGDKKRGCHFYTPHAHFRKGYKRSDGEPVDSGKAVIDLDGCLHFAELYEKHLKGREQELGINMVNRSVTGTGGHVLFEIPEGMSREEAQAWMAHEMGDAAYDKAVHERERAIYIPCREYILYIDEELMFKAPLLSPQREEEVHPHPLNPPEGGKKPQKTAIHEISQTGVQSQSARHSPPSCVPMEASDQRSSAEGSGEVSSFPTTYHGIPFEDILRKYWEVNNDGKEPTQGDRDTLTYQLACDLRHICGRNADWLDQVIPCYDGFSLVEKRQKIMSALQAKMEGMPYRLKQVLQALRSQAGVKACGGTLTTPPPMPKKLPPLVKLLTKNVPWFYKPAVASAVFPALGVHMHGVKFRYWDNVEHEPTFMNVLIGRQSIGKGTIKKPIEYIMEDIRQRDQPNRQREAEWKQKNPGAKPKKDPRPTDICIQMLIDNLTDAVFNQRIVDANNNGQRFIYTIVDEIEGLKKVTSKNTTDEVGLLIRKAFDNSEAGQERVGTDSVSGIAPLRWNFNASTTPPNAQRFFRKMVNDGTVSRLDIATIISNDDDDDTAPILGIYDHTFAAELKPYIDRLEAASGLIECPQAKRLALEMKRENRDAAKLYESEAYRVFSYRANVIAWLKGMVLYVAHGCKWSREIADFVRWSQSYNLWCKMLYFGQQLERELREEVEIQRQSGPQNLLELLPDEFTREQFRQMRQQQGRSGDGESTLRSWQSRGHIAYDETTGRYCKTEEYKRKYCK